MKVLYTLNEFIDLAESKGSHWFSPGTMRFFKTRLSHDSFVQVGSKVYFISSEAGPAGSARAYTIREGSIETSSVNTLGAFQEFRTIGAAKTALKRYLKDSKERAA